MDQMFYKSSFSLSYRLYVFLLSAAWIAGLVIGAVMALALKEYSVPLITIAPDCSLTLPGLVFALLIPSLGLMTCGRVSQMYISCILAFLMGTCWGHAVLVAIWSFGTSAWLLHFLLSFSNALILVPTFVLWFRCYRMPRCVAMKNAWSVWVITILIVLIDYFIVSAGVLTL